MNVEELKAAMTSEQVLHVQSVCYGAWINKFTNDGKGPLHPRFFWVNPSNCKVQLFHHATISLLMYHDFLNVLVKIIIYF